MVREIDEALLEARLSGSISAVGEVGAAGQQGEYRALSRLSVSDLNGVDGIGPDGIVVLLGPQLMRSLAVPPAPFLLGAFWSPVYQGWYVDVAYEVGDDEQLTRLLSCGEEQASGVSRLAELARQSGHQGTELDLLTGLPAAVVNELALGPETDQLETPQAGDLAPDRSLEDGQTRTSVTITVRSHSVDEQLHVCFRQSGLARCIPNHLDYEGTMLVDPTLKLEVALMREPSNDFEQAISRTDVAAVGSIDLIVDESTLSTVLDVESP